MLKPQENNQNDRAIHDINASLSALFGAIEIINEEWRTNPKLVDKILPLTAEKLNQLQDQISIFNKSQS